MPEEIHFNQRKNGRDWMRFSRVCFYWLAGVLGVPYLIYFSLGYFFLNNPSLSFSELRIVDLGSAPVAQRTRHFPYEEYQRRLAAAGAELGGEKNLLKLDIRKIRESLQQEPWFETVQVRRFFPHTLEVSVLERSPSCVLYDSRKPSVRRYADANGVVFPLDTAVSGALPAVLNVPSLASMKLGVPLALQGHRALVAVLQLIEKMEHFTQQERAAYKAKFLCADEKDSSITVWVEPGVQNHVLRMRHPRTKGKRVSRADSYPILKFPMNPEQMDEALVCLECAILNAEENGSTISFADVTCRQLGKQQGEEKLLCVTRP